MPILDGDIKLLSSQVMSDADESGGAPTATEIVSGSTNSIFPVISELDEAAGRINMRKIFLAIQSNASEVYYGANVIIEAPPKNPGVSVTLMTTKQTFDTRKDAASAVEAYMVAGPEISGYLLENHVAGQRAIQIMQRPGADLIPAGKTLMLVADEGLATEKSQYIRITRVTSETRQFSYSTGSGIVDFDAQVITCDLSDPLVYAFAGSPPSRTYARSSTKSAIRDMVVADAATYYSVTALSVAAPLGAHKLKLNSVYTQLVPSAQTENALLDQNTAGMTPLLLASDPRAVTVSSASHTQRIRVTPENRAYNYVFILKPLPAAGSVVVSYRAMGKWYSLSDSNEPGSLTGQGSGSVSYPSGSVLLTCSALPDNATDVIVSWGDTIAYTNRGNSGASVRPPEYTIPLEHSNIKRGSLVLTWQSRGATKTAVDNGTSGFTGDAAGVILYSHGIATLKPTELIDAGGQISASYDYNAEIEEVKTGVALDSAGLATISTENEIKPGSLSVCWVTLVAETSTSGRESIASGTSKSASTTQVTIPEVTRLESYAVPVTTYRSGPLTGTFNSSTRYETYYRTQQVSPARSYTSNASTSGGGSHSVTGAKSDTTGRLSEHVATDTGTGGWPGLAGVISYADKTFSLQLIAPKTSSSYKQDSEDSTSFDGANSGDSNSNNSGESSAFKGGEYATSDVSEIASTTVVVRYAVAGSDANHHTMTYTPEAVSIDLCPYTQDWIVPGSVQFLWMGHIYQDRDGAIYRDPGSNLAGSYSGSIDYTTGLVRLTDYAVGAGDFVLQSLWTTKAQPWHTSRIYFRSAESPLKSGGITVSVVDATGQQLIATSTSDGKFTGPHVKGYVDYESGVCELLFGDAVAATALTDDDKSEWWYDAADIGANGMIWRPWPVIPESMRYNAVSYSYLPLDAEVLGLSPVRLPSDGRVPIFRTGGFAVIGNTGTIGPAVVGTGQTIDCARTRLSRIRVIGNDGIVISTGFTRDLDAGKITFTDVTGYSQPVKIEHRIEDMVKLSDVQIDGSVSCVQCVTHDYPAGSSVSSALPIGDLYARVSAVFDQKTWTGAWSSTVIGDQAGATYNAITYPPIVSNRGAITERWAIVFTSPTTYVVIGEHVGQISTGNTGTDCAPINPNTGVPYLKILSAGLGDGWSQGNVLRIDTVGAMFPIWGIRTTQIGASNTADDSCTLLGRGDVIPV